MLMEKNFAGNDGFVWWIGVVENRQDPLKLGRCQVRFFGIHSDSLADIPSSSLPWAMPVHSLNTHEFTTPKETDVVFGFFADGGSKQLPIMVGIIPGVETNAPNTGTGYHDLRDQGVIKLAPKYPVGRTYNTDGTGIAIAEANIANNEVLESLRYPRSWDLNAPSIPSIAYGGLLDTDVMQSRINAPNPVIETANNQAWRKPPPTFDPKYPYNQAFRSESGHTLEFDDTPGAERVTLQHRSGTAYDVMPSGSKVEEIVRNNYKIVMADDHIHVMGHAYITVDSDVFIRANGDVFIESGNDLNLAVSGKMNLAVGEEFNIKAKSLNIDVAETTTVVSGTDTFVTSEGSVNLYGVAGLLASSGADIDLNSSGDTNIQAAGNVNEIGAKINMNSGGSAATATQGAAAGITAAAGRFSKNDNPPIIDGTPPFEVVAIADDLQSFTAEQYDEVRAINGLPPAQPEGPALAPPSSPTGGGKVVSASCGDVVLQDDYRKVKLSDHFTLYDYCYSFGTLKRLEDHDPDLKGGPSDILCAAVLHARNILEPLYAAGFRFTINSAFRRGRKDLSQSTIDSLSKAWGCAPYGNNPWKISDHEWAAATDLTNITYNGQRMTAYDAANKIYEVVGSVARQILLEYATSGGNGWVHVAYNKNLPPNPGFQFGTLVNNNQPPGGGAKKFIKYRDTFC
jgi:hypothetical protein